jgi:hypothetical protein
MASLRVIPYSYVPTKQHSSKHSRSSVCEKPTIQSSTTKSKPSVLPKEVSQPVPLEADVLARQLGKVYFGALATNIEIDSLYRTTTDESARQESQDVAHHSLSFTSCLIDQEASSRGSSYGHIEALVGLLIRPSIVEV